MAGVCKRRQNLVGLRAQIFLEIGLCLEVDSYPFAGVRWCDGRRLLSDEVSFTGDESQWPREDNDGTDFLARERERGWGSAVVAGMIRRWLCVCASPAVARERVGLSGGGGDAPMVVVRQLVPAVTGCVSGRRVESNIVEFQLG
ncbi:cAMP-dependent transcriptional regulator [Striga asiatica]|uniref:cAMP-dependent transcriptional regulator n=1 Tax=Striga asiatica TaxID=4170 RepID=A0A5A7PTU4_STRAF|nr:cAMP-dependent transcriptional regulator [Striga asiatica]